MNCSIKFMSLLLICFLLSCQNENRTAQPATISNTIEMKDDLNRIEPPNWWIGFKNQKLQLLVHHPNIGKAKAELDYTGVSIQKQHQAKSPNYLFLDLKINETCQSWTIQYWLYI